MKLILDRQVYKFLDKLNDDTYNRIKEAMYGLLMKPAVGDIKPLKGAKGVYRLRVGNYRIIYEPIDNNVYVHKISPRGDAYK